MYLRLSPYREILQGVLTSLQINEGIIKITGKSGAGKTALCSQLFHELDNSGQPAVFFLKPPASAVALQNDILDNLKLDPSGNFTRTLTAYLRAHTSEQKPLVLIFDDAQQLDPQTFSAIRMLCNIQDDSRAMVRVILCGTEELDEKLAGPALRAVTQFINQSFTLSYLTQEQVNDFCHAYWMLMGEAMKPMSERILQKLFQETRGHPGILHARLNQGTTGAEKSERQGREDSKSPAPSRPYRYAGRRKGWVPALLILMGFVVLGAAAIYLLFIPSRFEETVYPEPPAPEPPTVAQQRGPEITRPPVETTPAPTPVSEAALEPAVVASEEPAVEELTVEEPAAGPEEAATTGKEEVATADVPEEAVVAAPAESTPRPVVEPEPELPPVEDFLAAWTSSWQSKDVDAYLAHYHPDFVPPQGATLQAWQEQRRRVIGNASGIMISFDPPEAASEGTDGTRTVRFWLNYSAANYADRTLKELLLVPLDGAWRIRAESNLRTERL